VKFICFVRLEFKDVFELSTIISVMDMIAVIIDQGYMVSFGSSRLLAWIQKKNVLLLLIMDAKRETILVSLSFDHSLLKAIITPLYTFR
jgi:hypothetical protein